MGLWRDIKEDAACVFECDPAARSMIEVVTTYPGVHALIWHRITHRLWRKDSRDTCTREIIRRPEAKDEIMRNDELENELEEMGSAEDFLNFFNINYDPRVIMVNRLHILQRFHDNLEKDQKGPQGNEAWWDYYTRQLTTAYGDFTKSSAQKEKVFKVFQDKKPAFVPLEDLLK